MRLTQYACALTASLPLAPRSTVPQLNIFGDIFDDGLKAIEPYERPLLPSLVKSRAYSYTLQEKMFSFSGEDFKVKDLEGNDVLYIDGGNINLGGWVLDKLAFKDASTGQKFCSVERRAIAMSTCYDIYSADGSELLCKVERDFLSMTPSMRYHIFLLLLLLFAPSLSLPPSLPLPLTSLLAISFAPPFLAQSTSSTTRATPTRFPTLRPKAPSQTAPTHSRPEDRSEAPSPRCGGPQRL